MTETILYNDFDDGACAWIEQLIVAGLIPRGKVDNRSILDISPDDVKGFVQVHFFCGIAGWPYALGLAGWPSDQPVWTGSPPCQPFSAAGLQKGRNDDRHLAPHFINLVGACRPRVLFGEQVASSDVFGKAAKSARGNFVAPPQWAWLDDLSDRLEAARYAVGASDFPSAGVGAPHIRQRTFFGAVDLERLADSNGAGRIGGSIHCEEAGEGWRGCGHDAGASGSSLGLADCSSLGWDRRQGLSTGRQHDGEDAGRVQGHNGSIGNGEAGDGTRRSGPLHGFWSDADWLFCRDGKWRPVESGTFPLAHGVSGRVGLLRGYGNAINPWAAKEFIDAFEQSAAEIRHFRVNDVSEIEIDLGDIFG